MKKILFSVALMLLSLQGYSHGVQAGYCVLPNGFLRVYIEHWHGDMTLASLHGNGMSVTTTYGSTTVTQNMNPTGAINNTPVSSLPGCGSSLNVLYACPGQANTYNDWAVYDFAPAACNIPVSITLNGGLTVVLTESCSDLWPRTINATFTDMAGPILTCPTPTASVPCTATGANVNFAVTAIDNCTPNPTVTTSIASGSFFPIGTTMVTATSTDGNNNTSTCTFPVVVSVSPDVTPPAITCPTSVTVQCGASTAPAATGTATATDNCQLAGITHADVVIAGTCPANYTIARTWTATDAANNRSKCTQIITVQDNTAPSISCPADVTVSCTADNSPEATGSATASDNCSGALVTYSDATTAGNCSGSFVITRTWTATDGCGNVSSCNQTITVQDIIAPTISCPANQEITCTDYSAPEATGRATASDDCSGATVTYSDATTPGNCAGNYMITRTWTATDGCGNASSCNQTITVQDRTRPIAICKPATITLVNGTATVTPAMINDGSSDNCSGIASMSLSQTSFSCADIGDNPVTLTVTDSCGNTSTCSTVVTVLGTVPSCSVAVTPANNTYTGGTPTTIYLGYGPQSATATVTAGGGSGLTYSWSPSTNLSCSTCPNPEFTPTTAGNYSYTVTVTNANGCTTTCVVKFCVLDIRVPGNGNGQKVYICHTSNGNPAKANTLSVSTNAVASHLSGHSGDRLGTCDQVCSSNARMLPGNTPVIGEEVRVYPNPNSGSFIVELPYFEEEQALITLTDVQGRVIQRKIISDNDGLKINMNLGNVARGVYFIEVAYGVQRFRTKLNVQ